MGCICSKPSRTVEGQGNSAGNSRVSKLDTPAASTGSSPDQPPKSCSPPTETPITTPDNPGLRAPDCILNTQTKNVSSPPGVAPNQPSNNRLTPTGPSMTAPDTLAAPTASGAAVPTTHTPYTTTGPTTSESQPSEAQTKKNVSALWEEAFRRMPEAGCGRTGGQPLAKGSLVENIIKDLEEKKKQCDDKRWFFIMDDRKVFIVENLLVQLNKYAGIGDIALQHNPHIVALVWAGFRGLLQVGIAYVTMMRSISEDLDYLVKLLCCCDIYEKIYCSTEFDISKDLNESFVNLYVSILKYLGRTSSYLDRSTPGRIMGSFSKEMERFLDDIRSNETELNQKIDVAEKEASASNRFNQDMNIKKLRELLVGLQEPIKETLRVVEIIYRSVKDERRFRILTWLSEVEYKSHHLLSVRRRLQGTGLWLQKNRHFIKWRDSESNTILWLRADAGFGKTILASAIVDSLKHLSASNDHVVAYFYCNYKEPSRRSTDSILRTLLKQFCVKGVKGVERNRLPTLVDDIYTRREDDGNAGGQLSSEESTELIVRLSAKYQSTTILVDALDECDIQTRRGLFSSLHKIAQKGTRIKIVVTSRYDADINQFFSHVPNHYLEAKDNSADINLYIESELKRRCDPSNVLCEDPLLLEGEVDQDLRDLIEKTLKSKANGMFMWVNLQIDALCAAQTPGDVRSALSMMPETLNETYLQILQRIGAQDRNAFRVAKEILKWLLYAQGACSTASVIQALAVEPGKQTLSQNRLSWTIPKILGICKNLVIHDGALDVFRFAHLSVQEFLLSRADYERGMCHTYIAEVCLTTLLSQHPGTSGLRAQDLYNYAAKNWAVHVRLSAPTSGNVNDLCIEFLKPSTPYREWGNIITKGERNLRAEGGGVVTHLWAACYYELHHVAECLLHIPNTALNCRNSYLLTPLSWAAREGHEKVVQLLLEEEGVDVNSKETEGQTPLSWAARNGHEKVVQLLLEKEGVDADSKDSKGQTPLSCAAVAGYGKVVQLLLGKEGVDVNSKGTEGQTPLYWAARGGYEEVVQLLLENERVDVNSKDTDGRTPLYWAARVGHRKVVQMLLEKGGVDVNSKETEGRTPLYWAARNGHEEVVQLLLEKEGVDADSKDSKGQTPLSCAAVAGYEGVAQLLLEKEGVDVNSKETEGQTPLYWAARGGHEEVVQLLLKDERVDVNSKDTDGRTPFSWAAEEGHERAVQLLLENERVDVNSKDTKGRTPLSWAARVGHGKVVQMLLEKEGVDVNSKDSKGRTPLSRAALFGHGKVVQLLLEKEGVDVDSKDSEGRTPLSRAAQGGYEKMVQLLLEKEGVDVDSKDSEGHTPLGIAREGGKSAVVRLLERERAERANVLHSISSPAVEPITAHQ